MDVAKLEKLDEVLNGHINGEIVEQVITKLTAAGENYMSLILKVDLKVKNSSTNRVDSVHAVAKLLPPGFIKSGMTQMSEGLFKNEIAWYKDVLPIFRAFEEENDVVGVFTDIYPDFLGSRWSLNPESEAIDKDALVVLEYLEGYENDDRHIGFDYATTKEVLKALARFHALPTALKLQKPELFKEKILPHVNNMPKPPPPKKDDFNPVAGIIDIIKECPECQPFVARSEEALKHRGFDRDINSVKEPWATIAHNDFWVNNIMFKRDNGSPRTPKIKIVDYQGVWYASFAGDLTFFLLLSVQTEVLRQHFDELLKFYYDVLVAYLKQLKVEDTDQFKFEDFVKELETSCKTGQFEHTMFFTNVVYREKGEGPDSVLDENPDVFKNMFSNKTQKQKEKIVEITKFCAEKNWI